MSEKYCEEHPRIELIGDKCVACGEIPIKYKTSSAGAVMTAVYIGVIALIVISTLYSMFQSR